MFGTIMTVVLIVFAIYYGYNIIHDLYFDKASEVVEGERIEEKEVDIKDTLNDFKKYDATQDSSVRPKAPQPSESDDFDDSLEVSGGMDVDELTRQINECEAKGEDNLYDQMMMAVYNISEKAA
mgnify:CR=1 FL=1